MYRILWLKGGDDNDTATKDGTLNTAVGASRSSSLPLAANAPDVRRTHEGSSVLDALCHGAASLIQSHWSRCSQTAFREQFLPRSTASCVAVRVDPAAQRIPADEEVPVVVGHAYYRHDLGSDVALVYFVVTDPQHRGCGVGRLLMAALEDHAHRSPRGIGFFTLSTPDQAGFYERIGYSRTSPFQRTAPCFAQLERFLSSEPSILSDAAVGGSVAPPDHSLPRVRAFLTSLSGVHVAQQHGRSHVAVAAACDESDASLCPTTEGARISSRPPAPPPPSRPSIIRQPVRPPPDIFLTKRLRSVRLPSQWTCHTVASLSAPFEHWRAPHALAMGISKDFYTWRQLGSRACGVTLVAWLVLAQERRAAMTCLRNSSIGQLDASDDLITDDDVAGRLSHVFSLAVESGVRPALSTDGELLSVDDLLALGGRIGLWVEDTSIRDGDLDERLALNRKVSTKLAWMRAVVLSTLSCRPSASPVPMTDGAFLRLLRRHVVEASGVAVEHHQSSRDPPAPALDTPRGQWTVIICYDRSVCGELPDVHGGGDHAHWGLLVGISGRQRRAAHGDGDGADVTESSSCPAVHLCPATADLFDLLVSPGDDDSSSLLGLFDGPLCALVLHPQSDMPFSCPLQRLLLSNAQLRQVTAPPVDWIRLRNKSQGGAASQGSTAPVPLDVSGRMLLVRW